MKVILFNDDKIDRFYPLTFTRPISELRVGVLKLRQRIFAYFNQEEQLMIMDELFTNLYKERHPEWRINQFDRGEYLFINSRIIINDYSFVQLEKLKPNEIIFKKNEIVAFRTKTTNSNLDYDKLLKLVNNLKKIEADVSLWENNCSFIKNNSEIISQDFEDFFYEKDNYFETEPGVTVLNPYKIWLGQDVMLNSGVILDASKGAIIIDEGATIMHNSVIIGPVYIGKNTIVKACSKIYEGTSIGPHSKIGGEVEESIIIGYSNKQHDGFLGHSYVGEWVNLGANTNNSDLKNNYKNVKIYSYAKKSFIDCGQMFMGTIIGDHSKTGIGVSVNTGTTIGVGCNIFDSELISKWVKDFSWGSNNNYSEYIFDKFLDTAKTVKNRRDLDISDNEKILYKHIFENKNKFE